MKLQTQVPLKHGNNKVDYTSQLLLLGSCFVENIGEKLAYYKFQSVQNPFGILFHPKAIETLVANAIEKKKYTEEAVFFLNERWHCFDAHSNLSDVSKEKLLQKLNSELESTLEQITKATHIVITLGTAWVYEYIKKETIVANCHKVPQKAFVKKLLSVDEVVESLENSIAKIQAINPNVQFVCTVSPVRHLKDGFVENQQSKAHLITAIHQLKEKSMLSYFPSYEIMMDELRDYRFYANDMVHPNQLAVDYIWEKFSKVWVSEEAITILDKVAAVQRGLKHKAFNPLSKEHQQFLSSLEKKIVYLQNQYPFMKF